jgi:hypothetical protein
VADCEEEAASHRQALLHSIRVIRVPSTTPYVVVELTLCVRTYDRDETAQSHRAAEAKSRRPIPKNANLVQVLELDVPIMMARCKQLESVRLLQLRLSTVTIDLDPEEAT